MDDLKTPADDAAAAENFSHLLRRGIGGDIEVFRLYAQQQISDRPAYDVGFEPLLLQTFDGFSAAKLIISALMRYSSAGMISLRTSVCLLCLPDKNLLFSHFFNIVLILFLVILLPANGSLRCLRGVIIP